jgi:hypothetical protein
VITEDTFLHHYPDRDVEYRKRRLLRLNPKNIPQALRNYLSLRKQLIEEEQKYLLKDPPQAPVVHLKDQVLDFRLDQLAFVPTDTHP